MNSGHNPNDDAVKSKPNSTVGTQLAAFDNAGVGDVPSYERRIADLSKQYKEDPHQLMKDIEECGNALHKDRKYATADQIMNGLNLVHSDLTPHPASYYCGLYISARHEDDDNDRGWQSVTMQAK